MATLKGRRAGGRLAATRSSPYPGCHTLTATKPAKDGFGLHEDHEGSIGRWAGVLIAGAEPKAALPQAAPVGPA